MAYEYAGNRVNDARLKPAARLVPLLLLLLLACALLFYKERMLFIDAPHVLVRIINFQSLQVTEHRYGSFISQLFPLIAVKLHLPLMAAMILYSAGFYLFYLSVAMLLVYKFRDYGLTVLFGLYLTLFVSDTFYWPNNEVHQGIAWMMLAFAIHRHFAANKPLAVLLPLFAATFFLALWTHPLVMPVAVYLWFFFLANDKKGKLNRAHTVALSAVLLTLAYLKFHQGMQHGYDNTKLEIVAGFSMKQIGSVLSSAQMHYFLKSCVTNYWLFVLLFLSGLVVLVQEKRYWLLLLTTGFAGCYVLLICITYRDISSNRFYMESEYMPLSIICTAPFVYYLLPRLNVRLSMVALAAIFVVRLAYIGTSSQLFTARIAALNGINAKMKEKNLTKVIISPTDAGIENLLIMDWGAPAESILLSKLNEQVPQRSFLFANEAEAKMYVKTGTDTLLGCWEKRACNKLNSDYFKMDTTVPYQIVSYSDLMR